jgi:hypothetical protein
MKLLVSILGLLNGGYMLVDGIFVMITGKYIGPDKPGPWANLFYRLDVDVTKLGPLFVAFGLLWIIWLWGLWTGQSWMFGFGIVISVLTLWYLPIGTIISIIVLLTLLFARDKLGLH